MRNRLSIVLAVALASPAAHAIVINVPGDQPTIQAGIDAAADGDEVVVAPGTYVLGEFELLVINFKDITVRSSDGAAVTTVEGGGVFPVFHIGLNASTIEGFTITGGRQFENFLGGGVSILGGSPTVTDCVFTGNVATDAEGGGGIGGNQTASFTVAGCTFTDNTSVNGGAIFSAGTATITDCTFEGNATTLWDGGAVYLRFGTVDSCIFTGNSARKGGAVFSERSASVSGCLFVGNTSSAGGGGAYLDPFDTGSVVDCTFDSNVATGGSGGGLWLGDGGEATGCVFTGNTAVSGAGLATRGRSVTACTFDANTASGNGGGLHVAGTSPVVSQCTVRGNAAGTGGGMYLGNGVTATLTDTIFCQNEPDDLDSNGVLLAARVVIAVDGADCDDAMARLGACCLPVGGCVSTTESSCIAIGGAYEGEGESCAETACPEACRPDLDGNGAVGFADLLAVLEAWGVCP